MNKYICGLTISCGLLLSCSVFCAEDLYHHERKRDAPLNEIMPPAVTDINFYVTVQQPSCKIEVGQTIVGQDSIFLGKISNRKDTLGPVIPVNFRFSECQSQYINKVEYSADVGYDPNSGSTQGGASSGFVSTKIPEVKVYLWSDPAGQQKFTVKDFGDPGLQIDNNWVPICYAQAIVSDDVAKASSFEATAQFTITYN